MSGDTQRGAWVPIPDPTILTTAAQKEIEERLNDRLDREIRALDEKSKFREDLLVERQRTLEAKVDGMKELAAALKLASDTVWHSQYQNFASALDKTSEGIGQRIDGITAQISDMKDRLIRLEQASTSGAQGRISINNTLAIIIAGVSLVVLLGSLLIPGLHNTGGAAPQPTALAVTPLNSSAVAPR